MENNRYVPMEVLEQDFETDRSNHLQMLKNSFQYVFDTKEKDTQEANLLREKMIKDFKKCNISISEDVMNNSSMFLKIILALEKYWIIVTDCKNKQIVYANPAAKVFLDVLDQNGNYSVGDGSLLNELVKINVDKGIDHQINMLCSITKRPLKLDSFGFDWEGKDSILHFISDETKYTIAKTKGATHEDKQKMLVEAYVDPLTGVFNKYYAFEMMSKLLQRKSFFAVVVVNIRNLDYIHQKYDLNEGNKYISHVIQHVKEIMRATDFLARIEEDKFIVILANCYEMDATFKMRDINKKIRKTTGREILGISYGVLEIEQNNTLELLDILDILYERMEGHKELYNSQYGEAACSLEDESENTGFIKEQEKIILMDPNLNIPTLEQYEVDSVKNDYDKICVIRGETADVTIATYGEELYYKANKEVLAQVKVILEAQKLNVYVFDYKTYIIGGGSTMDDEEFLFIMEQMCEMFGFATSDETGLSGVMRFAVVLKHEKLVETAIGMLLKHQNDQGNFFVYDEDANLVSLSEEGEIVALIQDAIYNNSVKAFYQGIRNNTTNLIDTYEALMRIVDKNGRVYSPIYFLDTAKKYKLYEKLTYIMIQNVLRDFRHRTERVSMNVVTSDLQSETFRKWFFEQLDEFPNPRRLVLEMVESEEYSGEEELFEFIERVRRYGVKIAIDDFGTGYSNLEKVIDLKPDVIKIDGSIIKNICNDNRSKLVLDVIVSMSKTLEAYVVAEYIDSPATQEIIDQFKIACSQGFLYSKPMPIDKLPEPIPAKDVVFNHYHA